MNTTAMPVSSNLPKTPESAATARRLLDALHDEIDPDKLETARLLVTEVVTNAVRHVKRDGPINLRIDVRDDALRIEVHDPGHGFVPRRRGPDAPIDGQWGLHFLEILSDRWGIDATDRTRVWFELGHATG
jgi:anti-sigma regulatory factor (Ser/Thr protein kinase)